MVSISAHTRHLTSHHTPLPTLPVLGPSFSLERRLPTHPPKLYRRVKMVYSSILPRNTLGSFNALLLFSRSSAVRAPIRYTSLLLCFLVSSSTSSVTSCVDSSSLALYISARE